MEKLALLLSTLALVSLASGQFLSHDEAVNRLNANGIPIHSSGGCTDRYNPECTSLQDVRETTISGIITLKTFSGCGITVTAGTEVGHGTGDGYTHWNGWKLDISLATCIQNYVDANFAFIGNRPGDNAPMWQSGSGNVYARESNHWDITYYNCGGC